MRLACERMPRPRFPPRSPKTPPARPGAVALAACSTELGALRTPAKGLRVCDGSGAGSAGELFAAVCCCVGVEDWLACAAAGAEAAPGAAGAGFPGLPAGE